MQLDRMAAQIARRVVARFCRRAAGALLIALFALIALYQFTVAGLSQLTSDHGEIAARVIVALIYSAAALGTLAVLYFSRSKAVAPSGDAAALAAPELRIAALIESLLLGYFLARKQAR